MEEQVQAPVEEVQKVTINGQEYDPAEAQEYIDAGRKTRELEKQYNTSFDKVWPEYGKSQQTLKQTQAELTQARSQLEQFQQKKDAGTETPTDIKQAQEAARKLGIVLNEDIEKQGYIRKDDVEKLFSDMFQKYSTEQQEVNNLISVGRELEKKINGSDGRPAFNLERVLKYAHGAGITDLQKAYEDMYGDMLKGWQDKQIAAKRQPGLKTLPASQGNKKPEEVRTNNNNFRDRLKEALYSTDE